MGIRLHLEGVRTDVWMIQCYCGGHGHDCFDKDLGVGL